MDSRPNPLSGLESVLEAMPDAIIAVRADGCIAFANTQAERLFGVAQTDVIGRPVETLVPEALRDAHRSHRARHARHPTPRPMGGNLELVGRHCDGQLFPVEISLSSIDTEDGVVHLAAIRDLTERERLEQRFRDQNAALELAVSTKDRFLGRMSHELRTPLNAILGFTGTLLMELPGELNVEQRTQLETVRGSARRLLSLINDLLDLARIESGKVELSLESVDCKAVVDAVAGEFRAAAAAKGVDLDVVCPDREVHARADGRALQHIISNLVDNAVRVTDSGRIQLSVNGAAPGAPSVRIDVVDTGPGLDPADQDRIFLAFEDVGRSVSAADGTGLGLLISRLLAELLGGALRCSSKPGEGSTFTLELDRA